MKIIINNFCFFVIFLFIHLTICLATKDDKSAQSECTLKNLHPMIIITYNNITIVKTDNITIQHGERVTMRCRELGRYKLVGDNILQCQNGLWKGTTPSCTPTTSISNYTENVPPTILFGLPRGSAAIAPSGALAIFPGSILHLECLFSRHLGNPEWTWTSTFRQHLTGWAISPSEKDWKYRLSIYYIKNQDSGVYTCSTPKGFTNSIRIHVADIHCPSLSRLPQPMTSKIQGTRLGQKAEFKCPDNYRLNGSNVLTCQYNGKWSNKIPRCELIQCPPINEINYINPKLIMLQHNNSVNGMAIFTCLWGNNIVGSSIITCDENGHWNTTIPTCSQITCPLPNSPKNGIIEIEKIAGKKRNNRIRKVGSLLKFSCLPGHKMIGEGSIICTENGTWSHEPPICEVMCPYPGDPPHGIISPLKFWYKPGDTIQVTCSPGFVTPLEVKKPTCRDNGIWSGPPPPCRSWSDV
ncbi:hypothetical protein HCN44_001139 [Aphidius gifuensis]|uniref:Locomotion-related protein Hikaru genki n=1 Tax=Aphidius gifuensis TaxID=684658 RepID=A0A834XM67_APHGI|nr:locomotion-related protein Hikaru genki [Aphidius gifuensis]KAF7988566.1 hypothetical protein HCN44_001139 [Aphidius gifuensis]